MKNLAIIVIAVLGTSVAVFAQDGTKKEEPKKTVRRAPAKKQVSVEKKIEVPAEKIKK